MKQQRNFDAKLNSIISFNLRGRRFAVIWFMASSLLPAAAENDGAPNDIRTQTSALKSASFHPSCSGAAHEIRVTIVGVKENTGVVSADLYPNDQSKFLKGPERLDRVVVAAQAPMTSFCISAPHADKFAVSAYHDLDADGDFDKNALGLPAEPWGLSNNPKARFGPPPIEKALFLVKEEGAAIEIKLRQ